LKGILGRRVASDSEFDYSPALSAMDGIWTRKRLDAFLANPEAFVPGTSMRFAGIAEPSARSELIDFLEHAEDSELDVAPGGNEL